MRAFLLSLVIFIMFLFSCGDNSSGNISQGTIKGSVLDANMNAPISQAMIRTIPATTTVLTDNNGNFEIQVDVAGYYQIYASKNGYCDDSAKVKVISGKETNVTILLSDIASKNHPPDIPTSPNPSNYSTVQDSSVTLSWVCSDPDGDKLKYDLYFGTTNPPALKGSTDTNETSYKLDDLTDSTKYYWKVVAKDQYVETSGSVWSFTVYKNHTPPINEDALVAYYPFDGNTNDLSGNNYNGVIHGSVTLTSDRHSKSNSAYYINSGGYIEVPYSDPFNFQGDYTISAWIKPNSSYCNGAGPHVYLISRGPATPYVFDLGMTTNLEPEYWVKYNNGNYYVACSYPKVNDNTWNHIVAVSKYIQSTGNISLTLFLNGTQIVSQSFYIQNPVSNYTLMIGTNADHSSTYVGGIDDIAIYNRALTSNEIWDLYKK